MCSHPHLHTGARLAGAAATDAVDGQRHKLHPRSAASPSRMPCPGRLLDGSRVGRGQRHHARLAASLPMGDWAVPTAAARGATARPLPSHICAQHGMTLCSGVIEGVSVLPGAGRSEAPLSSADPQVAHLLTGTTNGCNAHDHAVTLTSAPTHRPVCPGRPMTGGGEAHSHGRARLAADRSIGPAACPAVCRFSRQHVARRANMQPHRAPCLHLSGTGSSRTAARACEQRQT